MFRFAIVTTAFYLLSDQVSALLWLEMSDDNGQIQVPSQVAVSYISPKFGTPIHFCQAVDNVSGQLFTGTFNEGESVCTFVDTETKEIGISKHFEVLVLNQGDEMRWKWAYPGEIPENAVPCDDSQMGGPPNCFLGVSLYSDGICVESIGKINPTENKIHMSLISEKKSEWCPFYMYLTVKQAATSLDLIDNEEYVIV